MRTDRLTFRFGCRVRAFPFAVQFRCLLAVAGWGVVAGLFADELPAPPSPAAVPIEMWLTATLRPGAGSGTRHDPIFLGTRERFDAFFRSLTLSGRTGLTFHFTPGIYRSFGSWGNYGFDNWAALSGWKFLGSGIDRTVLQLAGYRYLKPDDKIPAVTGMIWQFPWGRRGIEVADLTIDCNWTGFGTVVAQPFVVPPYGGVTAIFLADAERLRAEVGKYVYFQNEDRSVAGIYLLLSIDGPQRVTARNDSALRPDNPVKTPPVGPLPGGTVAAGCRAVPMLDTDGVAIGSVDCRVERVRVTNTGAAVYEAPIGVGIGAIAGEYPVKPATGNVLRDCRVDNLWGTDGWAVTFGSNNPTTGDDGTANQGLVEGNVVISSHQTHQGFGGFGVNGAVWRHNTARDCSIGWFEDVGYNRAGKIVDNLFQGCRVGIQMGGGYSWSNFLVGGNRIVVPPHGTGFLSRGNVNGLVFRRNRIVSVTPGTAVSAVDFGSRGNRLEKNFLSPGLIVDIPPAYLQP